MSESNNEVVPQDSIKTAAGQEGPTPVQAEQPAKPVVPEVKPFHSQLAEIVDKTDELKRKQWTDLMTSKVGKSPRINLQGREVARAYQAKLLEEGLSHSQIIKKTEAFLTQVREAKKSSRETAPSDLTVQLTEQDFTGMERFCLSVINKARYDAALTLVEEQAKLTPGQELTTGQKSAARVMARVKELRSPGRQEPYRGQVTDEWAKAAEVTVSKELTEHTAQNITTVAQALEVTPQEGNHLQHAIKSIAGRLNDAFRNIHITGPNFRNLPKPVAKLVLTTALSIGTLISFPDIGHVQMPVQPPAARVQVEARPQPTVAVEIPIRSLTPVPAESPQVTVEPQAESPAVIEQRRQESLKLIGGEKGLAELQEMEKPFVDAYSAYINLKVGDVFARAAFLEYGPGYWDSSSSAPDKGVFGYAKASAEQIQAEINRRLKTDPAAKKFTTRELAEQWLVAQKIGIDCSGATAAILEKAYEKLGLGNFYEQTGTQWGNVAPDHFVDLANKGKAGFYNVEDKAVNIMPGTVIVLTDGGKPVHAMMVIKKEIGEEGYISITIMESTDVTEGEKGVHSFQVQFIKPDQPLREQRVLKQKLDMVQLTSDNPELAAKVAKEGDTSYAARFWDQYMLIGNRLFMLKMK